MLTYLLAAVMMPLLASSAAPHAMTIHDLVAMDRISEPAVSPDGQWVAFTLSQVDLGANRRRADLWLTRVDGSGLRRLTTHAASDTSAAWSPDGQSLYFLSTRSGASQVWRLSASGGEAEAVTNLPLDVNAFRLSPDGQRLAVALDVFIDLTSIDDTVKRQGEIAARKASGRIYDRLFVRHWDTWGDGRRSHVFVMPQGGEPIDVMKGLDADCPGKPFGDQADFVFTPDGGGIVFSANAAGREEAWSTNYDLYRAPGDGSAAPRKLTENPAWDAGPLFSPDGRNLVYRAMARPGYEADRFQIVVRDWQTGSERRLAANWDRSPDELAFSRDGRTLYATADDRGQHALFAIDVATGEVRTLCANGAIHAPADAGAAIVVTRDHLRAPVELHTLSKDGADLKAITRVNAARVAAIAFGEPEQFTFAGANKDQVSAWFVKPSGFDPAKKYPLVLLIHGGPQGSFGNNFHYRWNPQIYAGAGYAALMVDFHGSTGYGQAFTDSIQGDWGGKPLVDLQKGLAAALARYGWIDGARVSALGASYGGYMINWIAGNWPDRFRCLVVHDGNLDERMAYFDTEELWFPERDHQGTPWDNPAGYARQNPIDFVARWKTPTLVIHGARDYRVVDTQGLSTFTALQRRGIPSRLLYFPDENHWVLKPANSILWHETVIEWLARWTAPASR
ncbi:MAG: S9 family peptidase [Vicinamibacteria bacterium]|nr:S9 family peptidase [Vicinamibacteria bacterium]